MIGFLKRSYEPLNRVLISKDALIHNLELFRKLHPDQSICPVLKANAYGHGLLELARILDAEACAYFVVDSLYEAYALKKAKIKTKILVLGYQNPNNLRRGLPFEFTAYDLASLNVLVEKNLPYHLEIDTGMKRMGLDPTQLEEALPLLLKKPMLFKGVFSHLMTADAVDMSRLKGQTKEFQKVLTALSAAGLYPAHIHLGNSAGAQKIELPHATMARIGLGLYGINPYEPSDAHHQTLEGLKPVLSIESTLIAVRHLQAGEAVGYGAQFVAPHPMTIGVLPFGYFEGLFIASSKEGTVFYKDQPCKIVGRINMNHTFLELPDSRAVVGEKVEVYSSKKERANFIPELAKQIGTIPYELLVRISPTIRRVVV